MAENEILLLIEKYLAGTATPEEQTRLLDWYRSFDQSHIEVRLESQTELSEIKERLFQRLTDHIHQTKRTEIEPLIERSFRKKKIYRWAAAASIILLMCAGSYFLFFNKKSTGRQSENSIATTTHDVKAPQTNRAMITLSNGQRVFLDSAGNGQLAMQGNIKLMKTDDGRIVYSSELREPSSSKGEIEYNTLANPRGSKVIDMTLADGSRVWLNAGSSITYPVSFAENERKVSMTGEAYFEVSHNASKPFKVSKGQTEITVLGTHFNVNAYDDEEAIRVTLLEGKVEVRSQKSEVTIKPGEQAKVASDELSVVKSTDIDEVMAWKSGMFSFNGDNIKTVMRQIARWYDVDVVYASDIKEIFFVKMNRNTNVSDVFKILQTTGAVHFDIEGKKITVRP